MTSVSSISLKLLVQKVPFSYELYLNDYSGFVYEQEANSVANKSEYIRKEYARKSLKGLKYKKQKKENWMFCKVYKENQKRLEKYTT